MRAKEEERKREDELRGRRLLEREKPKERKPGIFSRLFRRRIEGKERIE